MRQNKTVTCCLILGMFSMLMACTSPSGGQGVAFGEVSRVTVVDTVEGSGAITPRHVASLTWQTSGTVGKVYVKVGQMVKGGDILASLSPESLSPSILQAQVDLIEAQRKLEEVQHSSSARAQAQLALAEAEKAYEKAKANYDALSRPRASKDTIEYYEAQYVLAQKEVERAQWEYDQTAGLSDSHPTRAAAYSRLYNAIQKRNQILATLNWLTGKPTTTDQAITVAEYEVAKAALEDAQREWERLKDGPDPNDVAAAQAAVQEAQNRVNAQHLIAPFDGEVIFVNNEPGDVVEAGTLGIELLDRSRLYVMVSVDESKILQVQVGDKATITIEALPDLVLTGKVASINPLGEVNQGVLYFDVYVQLDESDPRLLIGATADVTIQLDEPQEALAVPATAIQSDSEGEYVYVLDENGNYRRVNVVSGRILDDDRVIISGDLNVGDRVLLLQQTTVTTVSGGRSEGPRPGGGFVIGP